MIKSDLIGEVLDFLKSTGPNNLFFMASSNHFHIQGIVGGQAIFILVIDGDEKISHTRINFSAKVMHAGGKFYVFRSIDDACEIAKIEGFHDKGSY